MQSPFGGRDITGISAMTCPSCLRTGEAASTVTSSGANADPREHLCTSARATP
jgi:hypothetical protein